MTGFINVNKAAGVSSAHEVAIIKRLTHLSCGHMGTLDPMATGVLPVAVGNATRLFNYLLSKRKRYIADFLFGIDTDTLDATGRVLSEGGLVPKESEIVSVLDEFKGDIMQTPPLYSAKSIGGERGYKIARRGEQVCLKPVCVNIGEIKLISSPGGGVFRFEIECGSGTYIRSLARDIGQRLGTAAVMSALVRTQSGCFYLKDSVKTQELTEENVYLHLVPADSVLPYPEIRLTPKEERRYVNGLFVELDIDEGEYRVYLSDGVFYGTGYSDGSKLVSRLKLC